MIIDVIVDIETLGRSADCAVMQIGAVAFERSTFKEVGGFNVSVKPQGNITINADTLRWWLKTNHSLLEQHMSGGNYNHPFVQQQRINGEIYAVYGLAINEKEMLCEFRDWLLSFEDMKNVYLWGNGIMFDNRLVREKLEMYGYEYPILYRNDRDIRTFVEVASDITGCESEKAFREKYVNKNTEEHDALNDCYNEYEALKMAFKIIKETKCE